MRVQPEEAIVSRVVGIITRILDGSPFSSRVSESRDGWGRHQHGPCCSCASEFHRFANFGVGDLSDARYRLVTKVAQHDQVQLPMRSHQFCLLGANLANMVEKLNDFALIAKPKTHSDHADTNNFREI